MLTILISGLSSICVKSIPLERTLLAVVPHVWLLPSVRLSCLPQKAMLQGGACRIMRSTSSDE